jgi:hypothetical protein
VLLAAAAAGVLPLASERLPRSARQTARGAAALAGLVGALLVVLRAADPPRGLGTVPLIAIPGASLQAGPFVAFTACAGVAGGSLLAGIGHRFFERARHAGPATAAAVLGCAVIVVATWLPWVHPRVISFDGFGFGTSAPSAWTALRTLAVLLVLGALATVGAALIGLAFSWRAVFLATALAGWLEAAFAVAGAPYAGRSVAPAGLQAPAGYAAGYYTCLVGAAIVVLAGLAAALTQPADG